MAPLTVYDNDTMKTDVDEVYVDDERWGVLNLREREIGKERHRREGGKGKTREIVRKKKNTQ